MDEQNNATNTDSIPVSTIVVPNPTYEQKYLIKQIQSRFRSKAAWISITSLIIFVLKTYFNFEIPKIDELVNYLLLTLTALGVFNNPLDKNSF